MELCESILRGVLRGVDFKYREPGVDRPMTKKDNEEKNLNKTNYRNQINKVALAIREIISSITHYGPKYEVVAKEVFKPLSIPGRNRKTALIVTSAIALILIIAGVLFIPKLFKEEVHTEKSIAVLPFVNLSNDPEQEYFSDGMVDEIIDRLYKVGDLKVISRTSSMRYKNSNLTLKEIARELNVSSILEGSVRKNANNVRITVKLIDAGTDTH